LCRRSIGPRPVLDKNSRPYLKNNKSKKRTAIMIQTEKHLPASAQDLEFKPWVSKRKKIIHK
jgi:hypothetical protein